MAMRSLARATLRRQRPPSPVRRKHAQTPPPPPDPFQRRRAHRLSSTSAAPPGAVVPEVHTTPPPDGSDPHVVRVPAALRVEVAPSTAEALLSTNAVFAISEATSTVIRQLAAAETPAVAHPLATNAVFAVSGPAAAEAADSLRQAARVHDVAPSEPVTVEIEAAAAARIGDIDLGSTPDAALSVSYGPGGEAVVRATGSRAGVRAAVRDVRARVHGEEIAVDTSLMDRCFGPYWRELNHVKDNASLADVTTASGVPESDGAAPVTVITLRGAAAAVDAAVAQCHALVNGEAYPLSGALRVALEKGSGKPALAHIRDEAGLTSVRFAGARTSATATGATMRVCGHGESLAKAKPLLEALLSGTRVPVDPDVLRVLRTGGAPVARAVEKHCGLAHVAAEAEDANPAADDAAGAFVRVHAHPEALEAARADLAALSTATAEAPACVAGTLGRGRLSPAQIVDPEGTLVASIPKRIGDGAGFVLLGTAEAIAAASARLASLTDKVVRLAALPGMVIGPGGERVLKLRDEHKITEAHVEEKGAGGKVCTASLMGTPEAVESAAAALLEAHGTYRKFNVVVGGHAGGGHGGGHGHGHHGGKNKKQPAAPTPIEALRETLARVAGDVEGLSLAHASGRDLVKSVCLGGTPAALDAAYLGLFEPAPAAAAGEAAATDDPLLPLKHVVADKVWVESDRPTIIGKGGKRLKELHKASPGLVRVHIDEEDDLPSSVAALWREQGKCELNLLGSHDGIGAAKRWLADEYASKKAVAPKWAADRMASRLRYLERPHNVLASYGVGERVSVNRAVADEPAAASAASASASGDLRKLVPLLLRGPKDQLDALSTALSTCVEEHPVPEAAVRYLEANNAKELSRLEAATNTIVHLHPPAGADAAAAAAASTSTSASSYGLSALGTVEALQKVGPELARRLNRRGQKVTVDVPLRYVSAMVRRASADTGANANLAEAIAARIGNGVAINVPVGQPARGETHRAVRVSGTAADVEKAAAAIAELTQERLNLPPGLGMDPSANIAELEEATGAVLQVAYRDSGGTPEPATLIATGAPDAVAAASALFRPTLEAAGATVVVPLPEGLAAAAAGGSAEAAAAHRARFAEKVLSAHGVVAYPAAEDAGALTLVGSDAAKVAAAQAELEALASTAARAARELTLRLEVPTSALPHIVGKGGTTIAAIKEKTGAFFNIPQLRGTNAGGGANAATTALVLRGQPEELVAAKGEILRIVDHVERKQLRETEARDRVQDVVRVDGGLMSSIIGKGGANLVAIQNKYNVLLDAQSAAGLERAGAPVSEVRKIRVVGAPENVAAVAALYGNYVRSLEDVPAVLAAELQASGLADRIFDDTGAVLHLAGKTAALSGAVDAVAAGREMLHADLAALGMHERTVEVGDADAARALALPRVGSLLQDLAGGAVENRRVLANTHGSPEAAAAATPAKPPRTATVRAATAEAADKAAAWVRGLTTARVPINVGCQWVLREDSQKRLNAIANATKTAITPPSPRAPALDPSQPFWRRQVAYDIAGSEEGVAAAGKQLHAATAPLQLSLPASNYMVVAVKNPPYRVAHATGRKGGKGGGNNNRGGKTLDPKPGSTAEALRGPRGIVVNGDVGAPGKPGVVTLRGPRELIEEAAELYKGLGEMEVHLPPATLAAVASSAAAFEVETGAAVVFERGITVGGVLCETGAVDGGSGSSGDADPLSLPAVRGRVAVIGTEEELASAAVRIDALLEANAAKVVGLDLARAPSLGRASESPLLLANLYRECSASLERVPAAGVLGASGALAPEAATAVAEAAGAAAAAAGVAVDGGATHLLRADSEAALAKAAAWLGEVEVIDMHIPDEAVPAMMRHRALRLRAIEADTGASVVVGEREASAGLRVASPPPREVELLGPPAAVEAAAEAVRKAGEQWTHAAAAQVLELPTLAALRIIGKSGWGLEKVSEDTGAMLYAYAVSRSPDKTAAAAAAANGVARSVERAVVTQGDVDLMAIEARGAAADVEAAAELLTKSMANILGKHDHRLVAQMPFKEAKILRNYFEKSKSLSTDIAPWIMDFGDIKVPKAAGHDETGGHGGPGHGRGSHGHHHHGGQGRNLWNPERNVLFVVNASTEEGLAKSLKTVEWRRRPEERLSVPTDAVGKLIGEGGATIKKMNTDSGASIILGEVNAVTDEAGLIIRGSTEAIARARALVEETLLAARGPGREYAIRVPECIAPWIIGPRGDRLYKMLSDTHTHANFLSPEETVEFHDRSNGARRAYPKLAKRANADLSAMIKDIRAAAAAAEAEAASAEAASAEEGGAPAAPAAAGGKSPAPPPVQVPTPVLLTTVRPVAKMAGHASEAEQVVLARGTLPAILNLEDNIRGLIEQYGERRIDLPPDRVQALADHEAIFKYVVTVADNLGIIAQWSPSLTHGGGGAMPDGGGAAGEADGQGHTMRLLGGNDHLDEASARINAALDLHCDALKVGTSELVPGLYLECINVRNDQIPFIIGRQGQFLDGITDDGAAAAAAAAAAEAAGEHAAAAVTSAPARSGVEVLFVRHADRNVVPLMVMGGAPDVERAVDRIASIVRVCRAGDDPKELLQGIGTDRERVLLPKSEVAQVIGRGGSSMRKIQRDTGATFSVLDPGEGVEGAEAAAEVAAASENASVEYRVVEVGGSLEAIENARAMMEQYFTDAAEMDVPNRLIGHIMGRGGHFVELVRTTCRVSVAVESPDGQRADTVWHTGPDGMPENLPAGGEVMGRLELRGPREGVKRAMEMVAARMDDHFVETIEVPMTHVGLVLGKGGDTLHKLRKLSGAYLQVAPESALSVESTGWPVQLIGTRESVDKLKDLIKRLLEGETVFPAPGAAAGEGGRGGGGGGHHGQGFTGSEVNCEVPAYLVGRLLGKGGEHIQALQAAAGGANVTIQHSPQSLEEYGRKVPLRIRADHQGSDADNEAITEKARLLVEQWVEWAEENGGGGIVSSAQNDSHFQGHPFADMLKEQTGRRGQRNMLGGRGAAGGGGGGGGRGGGAHAAAAAPPRPTEPVSIVVPRDGIGLLALSQELGVKWRTIVMKMVNTLGMKRARKDAHIHADDAELIALEFGHQVTRGGAGADVADAAEHGDAAKEAREDDEAYAALPLRPAVVSVMGHVDHGKTTLLDALRCADVAGGEAGGITQKLAAFTVRPGGAAAAPAPAKKAKGKKAKTAKGNASAPAGGRTANEALPEAGVTFLDTPGHAVFSAMRSNGVQATDVICLCVDASQGIQPQTEEVLALAKQATEETGAALLVAMTKIDVGGVNLDEATMQVENELMERGFVPERHGGDVQVVPVSAITGEGLDDLASRLALQADLLDLRADPDAPCEAIVVDSSVEKGVGVVADVLVRWGTLRVGDNVVIGKAAGKVRRLLGSDGRPVKEAGPSEPVRVSGLSALPAAGDALVSVASADAAKEAAEYYAEQAEKDQDMVATQSGDRAQRVADRAMARLRQQYKNANRNRKLRRAAKTAQAELTSAELEAQAAGGAVEAPIVVKAASDGELAAMLELIDAVPTGKVRPLVVLAEVGPVTASDVDAAVTGGSSAENAAPIFAFNVGAEGGGNKALREGGVQLKKHNIIYAMMDDLYAHLAELLPPEYDHVPKGKATVAQVFTANKKPVGGVRVTEGTLAEKACFRVTRGGVVVYDTAEREGPGAGKDGAVALRHFKEQVAELGSGQEGGVSLGDFAWVEGDEVECFAVVRRKPSLE